MFANALQLLGTKRAFVVHGHDGLDEITVCAPTRVSELKDGLIRTYDIFPENFFGQQADPEDLLGGNPEENAQITRNILGGETGPRRDVVLINSAAALVAAEAADDLDQGIRLAETSIDKGAAAEKMQALIQYTQENG
jgi:anthranilate phosphoribosyltransferase